MHKDEVSNKNGMTSALNQDAKCWRFGASPGGSRGKPIMRVPSVGGAPTEEHTTLPYNKTRNTSFYKWKGRKCCCSQFGSSLFNFPPPSNPKKDANVVWRGKFGASNAHLAGLRDLADLRQNALVLLLNRTLSRWNAEDMNEAFGWDIV